ncbi:hypothetical protein [Vulcanisaeta thermophila]|uniref:hypothetical protein n=1 Tax=Vulcanisaeta thermophila TaxID=867917 RepID=UPI00117FED50|nr:hypothetical protein [Vulcanisaeta thermophila]
MASRGQARVLEAIAAIVILIITTALLPTLLKSPTTNLQSQVEVGSEAYAYNVLGLLVGNPQFINVVYTNNWPGLYSLMNTVIGPQYNWYIAIIPYSKLLTTVPTQTSNYVALPIDLVQEWLGYIPMTSPGQSRIVINLYTINELLPTGYTINTTAPMSNIAFEQCQGGNCKLINWWLESFDPRTGVAVVWLNTTGVVNMIISRNPTYPYNPITNQYCTQPYCYPVGGVSNFMSSTYNLNLNNKPGFLNYTTQLTCNGQPQSLPTQLITNAYSGPLTSTCTYTPGNKVYNNYYGFTTYMIGQLINAIPESSVSLMLSNGAATLYSCTPISCNQVGSVNIGNIALVLTYGYSHEYLGLEVNNQLAQQIQLPTYYYTYLLSLHIQPEPLLCAITINATFYDYVTTTSYTLNYTYNLGNCNGANEMTLTFSGVTVSQETPSNPIGGVYYLYSMRSIIYDIWTTPTPTTNYYMPVYTNYSLTRIAQLNVVPPQYSMRIPTTQLIPTATAMGIVQLPNGTYYLVILELMSLGG